MRVGLFLFILFLGRATLAESANLACEGEAISRAAELGEKARAELGRIYNPSGFFRDDVRAVIQEFYKIGRGCSSINTYRQISKELLSFGFPPQYLPGMMGEAQKQLGFRSYQIGETWDRTLVNRDRPPSTFPLNRLYNGLVVIGPPSSIDGRLRLQGAGTGFLVYVHKKFPIILTANHVLLREGISVEQGCQNFAFHFPSGANKHYYGSFLVGSWPEIDVAMCALEVPDEDLEELRRKVVSLDLNSTLELGTPLSTIGYGYYNNPHIGLPTYEESDDCAVIIGQDHMAVANGINVLATGCDASPGDSGSPVADRASGKVVGLLASLQEIRSPVTVKELISWVGTPLEPNILPETSLMVPTTEMARVWRKSVLQPSNPLQQEILSDLILRNEEKLVSTQFNP